MTQIPEAAVEAAAIAMLTPQMRRILAAAGLEYEPGQDGLMAQQARLGLEAAAPLIAPPDGAVEAAVLAEREAAAQIADSYAVNSWGEASRRIARDIRRGASARSASPKPGSGV